MSVKKKRFNVMARLTLEVSVPITADNFTDAIEQSKTLKEQDFVKILGEFMDGAMEIIGIEKDHPWPSQDEG